MDGPLFTFEVMVSQEYFFKAVSGSKEEVAFKDAISEAVLEHDFMPSVSQQLSQCVVYGYASKKDE